MMKKLFVLFSILCLVAGCSLDDAEYLVRDELGTSSSEYVVGADIGTLYLNVLANKQGTVRVIQGESWLHAVTTAFSGDTKLRFDYLYNEEFPRLGKIELNTGTRRDTITIKQKGLVDEVLDFPSTSILVYNGKGQASLPVVCNVNMSEVTTTVEYIDDNEWISQVVLDSDELVFTPSDNTDAKHSRKARIRISYKDGWESVHLFFIQVTQMPSTNTLGELLSFEQLRSMSEGSLTPLSEDYCIDGYVVSRPESGNVGENAMSVMNYIDYDAETCTVYIESLDGKYGFRLRTATSDDNVFKPDTKVRLSLGGAVLNKEEDPERYTILGVTSDMVVESNAVDVIPVKSMYMSELKDSDIYTYVTLKDCEIPVRKGCLTPVNEGYTMLFNSDRVNKFPIIIRDIQGESMYMYTNTTCPYRRDGNKLPYGKGTVSGVIVHEKYRQFVDEDNADEELCGTIGRYQIRHMRYSDLALEDDIKNGFSALLTEYRYMNIPSNNPDHLWVPTYGNNGYFTHSYSSYVNGEYKTHGWPSTDFTYLGPCGNAYKTNENGFGVILEDGTDYGRDLVANETGKGISAKAMKSCWANTTWWNNNRAEAWIIEFSTMGVQSDVVSMQLSTHNIAQALRTPRYWKAEWSFDCDMSASADSKWHMIGEYTVPDIGINSNTLMSQSLGFKQIDFRLPADILGHEHVYIRLMPTKNAASSGNDYDSSTIKNGNANAINYFAIRYNK